jgi:hypothetical protein
MTFSVLHQQDMEVPRIVGTLWADDEVRAQTLAATFFSAQGDSIVIRRTETQELPMRFDEPFSDIH